MITHLIDSAVSSSAVRCQLLPLLDPTRASLYSPAMAARPVKIPLDSELLDRIDEDPEVRQKGRSAFIRSAVHLYLQAKQRREVEARLAQAYAGEADQLLEEVEELMVEQG